MFDLIWWAVLGSNQWKEHDNKSRLAEDIAVQAGALQRCDFHNFVYDNWGDPTDAYRLGNAKFTAGEINGEFASRREMTDYIQAVICDSADECGSCAKIARE